MGILDTKKKKVEKIFQFMKAFNELKNPVPKDIDEYKWSLKIDDTLPNVDECKSVFFHDDCEDILKVTRTEMDPCPEPDDKLLEWLESGWEKLKAEPRIIESKDVSDDEENIIIYFKNFHNLKELYNDWKKERDHWKREEFVKKKCNDLYDKLFSLYSEIQRDSEGIELILGDGLLTWNLADGRRIKHPILIQKTKLKFNPSIPEFSITVEEEETELYTALLRTVEDTYKRTLGILVEELKENNYQIAEGKDETNSFLKRFITSIVSDGVFLEEENIDFNSKPTIVRKPVVFLRKRTLGYSVMINSILDDIKKVDKFPEFINQIIGEVSQDESNRESITQNSINVNGIDKDVLLSKPANKEQLHVAKILDRHGAVLVQGPPGTGKTHTISNIIGHLLSEGKSILVTSHTEKALSVLKEKIQESIQPLCLSVTGSRENKKEMNATLNEMNLRRSNINEHEIVEEIKALENKRRNILENNTKLRENLMLARNNEYKDIILSGESYKPIKAAKILKENINEINKIPSPVEYGTSFPLGNEELLWLYRSNELVSKQEEKELCSKLPTIEDLLTPEKFEALVESLNIFEKAIEGWESKFWDVSKRDSQSFEELQKQSIKFEKELSAFDQMEIEIIDSGIENGSRKEQWEKLFKMVRELKIEEDNMQSIYLDFNPQYEFRSDDSDSLKYLTEIIEHLDSNKSLSKITLMFKKGWKDVLSKVKVNGRTPENTEEFQKVRAVVEHDRRKKDIFRRWERQITADTELNSVKDIKIAYQHVERLSVLFSWYSETWVEFQKNIVEHGFKWDEFTESISKPISKYAEIDLLKEYGKRGLIIEVEKKSSSVKLEEKKGVIRGKLQELRKFIKGEETQLIEMVRFIDERNTEEYKQAYQGFISLINKNETLQRRRILIEKVRKLASTWADHIENREGIHGEVTPPENMCNAWKIRQINDELKRRHTLDMEEVQSKIASGDKELKRITEELVDRKAWHKKISSMTQQQIQAIEGWRGIMKKIGRGTGKRAPKLQAEARRLMPVCQTAIPVWIMPLSKVVESFDPSVNKFDVVIIDEASQADIMAMNAVYLGKKVIIVGDDEQVSPSAVGQKLDQVQSLIDTYLDDIPNSALFDGQMSIYDLARTSGFKPVTLTEHFRCLSPIINFSNYLSYDGNIKPLRDEGDVSIKPALVEYRVDGGLSENKINIKEAESVVALIMGACRRQEYKGMTFGVISLVGDKQAAYIDKLLQTRMNPVEYTERRIQCGNPAAFQGDERDIIFLSMVDSPKEDGGPLNLRSAESRDMYKKRYNVAASRAKDQMWVVHSLDADFDLKEGDIRKRLIKHVQNPDAYDSHLKENLKKSESPFETEVMKRIISAGYRIIPQWKVGSYRIDMVVEGSGRRLAVECDGEKWHTADNLAEDMNRQAILERLGWTFIRIRGSEFYKDPEKSMNRVFERIKQLEISPEFSTEEAAVDSIEEKNLRNDVVREAREIMREWDEETGLMDNE